MPLACRKRRRLRAGLLAAIVLPALAAGGAVLALAPHDVEPDQDAGGSAAQLAREAERPRTIGPPRHAHA